MNLLVIDRTQTIVRRRKRIAFTLVKCAALGLFLPGCGGGGQSSNPAGSDIQRSVVFQSNRDGDFEILRMRGDGSNIERITDNATNDDDPSLSSDGKSIVFASIRTGTKEIYVIDARGTRQITRDSHNNELPHFSSDGKKIIFKSTRQGESNIFLFDVSSGEEKQLTFSNSLKGETVFSNQGKILFSSNMNSEFLQIYEMNDDGQQIQKITNDESNHPFLGVSRDNKHIVFSSDSEGFLNIYLMERATGTIKTLTSQSKNNTEPTFSRDGQSIFFASDRTGNYDIYSMNLEGGDVRNLTNHPASDRAPSVQ